MRLQIIVILLAVVGIAIGLAQLGEEYITITVTSEGKSKISQTLFPKTYVSTIDVHIISEKISNLLAIDEKDILLGTTQNQNLLKIATLGASAVDLKYNADILTYESGVFKLKYNSDLESRVSLPPLSKLVSLNTIPIEITDEYVLPPGDISLSFTIRPITSKEFFVTIGDSEQKVEAITAAKIEEFSANADEIQFIIKDKAVVLTIIPIAVMVNPNDALLNGEEVDFSLFHQNATHSWIRIDPHEKGLVKILDTGEKLDEGGGCLIATATYGSEMAPQVQFLREIRDNQLMSTDSGVSFMTGFNQFYYSFSPYIADLERENPLFKEFVKIAISPMLLSLSIMTFAESENEILGLGIGVILINIGMYFVLPFVICYQAKKMIRTKHLKKENIEVKFNFNVLSVVKTSLFGLIVLLVMVVSVSTAFAQEVPEPESPIKIILDITKENADDALGDDPPSTADTLFSMGVIEYDKAIVALGDGDIEAAEEFALIAMALFEDATETAGVLGDTLVLDQLPPGFGAGVISPGIMKQLTAADIFNLQNEITEIEFDADNLRDLVSTNNFDVDFSEYDKSVYLAKEILARGGEIPNARAQLELANGIKNSLYDQIDAAVKENEDERIQEFVENSISSIEEMLEEGENLGLTKKAISELESTLDVLISGDTDEILEKTSDKSEYEKEVSESRGDSDYAPGQYKDDAPGQDKDEADREAEKEQREAEKVQREADKEAEKVQREADKDAAEASRDNPSENGFGLGKIPPGLAKLFGYDDGTGDNANFVAPEGLPPGLGLDNIPPGQLKKFEAGLYSVYSPDDYFDDPVDDLAEDNYEDNYDSMNKYSKAKEQQMKEKDNLRLLELRGNTGDNTNCNNIGITDGEASNTSGTVGEFYTVQGFTGIGSNCKDITNEIQITIDGPSSPPPIVTEGIQPLTTFQPNEAGTWIILAQAAGQFTTRTVNVVIVGTAPSANAGPDQTVVELSIVMLDGSASTDPDQDDASLTYLWVKVAEPGGAGFFDATFSDYSAISPTFTTKNVDGSATYTFILTVTDSDGNQSIDTVDITVNDDTNISPTANAGPDQPPGGPPIPRPVTITLDATGSTDSDGTIVSYSWVQTGGTSVTLSDVTATNPEFTPTIADTYQFTVTVTDNNGATDSDVVQIRIG